MLSIPSPCCLPVVKLWVAKGANDNKHGVYTVIVLSAAVSDCRFDFYNSSPFINAVAHNY